MAISVTDKLTGKNGYILWPDAPNNLVRVKIPFVSWTSTTTTAFSDFTSTVHYSKKSDLVFRASVPEVQSLTVEVVGRYHISTTPNTVIASLFDGKESFLVELGFSPRDPYVDFYACVEQFEISAVVEDVVTFTCTLRSDGEIGKLEF